MKEKASTEWRERTRELWQNATWYRALTLSERMTTHQNMSHDPASDLVSQRERARQRFQLWKEQTPFHKDSSFPQRLAQDTLTEEDLMALLSEPAERLLERSITPPAWLLELARAFEDQKSDDDFLLLLPDREDAQIGAFLLVLKPLLRRGCVRLQAGIQKLIQKYGDLPFDPQTLLPLLFRRVSVLTMPKMVKTLVLELHVARLQGRLQGETPQDRFRSFLDSLMQGENILALFEEYPVLARSLVETIQRWVARELEFLERLCTDWKQIREVFTPDADPGVLTELNEGEGDTHRDGRCVLTATWSSGFRLVYKPRSLATDCHFQEVLTWLNIRGYQPAFRTLRLLNKETHGWVEFVPAHGCTSVAEIERFYQRQGGYLALSYVLQASDLHAENWIASGEHPVPIDLETLFHPRVSGYDAFMRRVPGREMLAFSVMRTCLLPQRIWSTEEFEGVDISGLGGKPRQRFPGPVSLWTDIGTDQMRLTSGEGEIGFSRHQPLLHGQTVETQEYCESIVAGFTAFHHLLMQHRDAFIAEILPRFAQDEIRCLLRPTRDYGRLLEESFHADVLHDALDRDRFFDRLWIPVGQQSHLSRLIPAERFDLLNDDIPFFSSYPNSRHLFTSRGEVITDIFQEPGLEMARKCIQQFDEHDLEKQIWIIRASFASLGIDADGLQKRLHLQPVQHEATPEQLITATQAVGDRLLRLAISSDDAAGWLGVTPIREREWQIAPTDGGLYEGTAGIALFLGYLGQLTGEEKYTALARAALAATRRHIEDQLTYPGMGQMGPFVAGISSLVYLLSHLGTVLNAPALYQEAEELVKPLSDIIKHDEIFDLLGGSAGCISALLSLYAVAPSPAILSAVLQCGDHLIAHAQRMQTGIGWITKLSDTPLAGLAHGNAGIALGLLRLFGVTQEERFLETALAAIQYERCLFSLKHKNWRDLRQFPGVSSPEKRENASMVAWCHGAAGIGLGRLESLPYIDNGAVREEVQIALETTLASGFGSNHSLCHGDMGNAEVLLMAAQILDDPELRQTVRQLSSMLLKSIEAQGWVCGIPLGRETPGLMTGLAGIGYALLRWAAPARIPSVLVLAPPVSSGWTALVKERVVPG